MAIRTYKVTLDSKNTIAPEPVYLRQGDKTGAVVIDATLMDNGSPVSLSGLTPMFKANTADGQAVIADSTGFTVTDSANGKFTYQVPNALSAIPGKITTAYFSLSDADGSESTFDVAFIIKAAVDMSKTQADDYITIIDGTLNSLQKKIDAMNTDVQTILNAYNQGDFYNKSETDNKYAEVTAQLAEDVSGIQKLDATEIKNLVVIDKSTAPTFNEIYNIQRYTEQADNTIWYNIPSSPEGLVGEVIEIDGIKLAKVKTNNFYQMIETKIASGIKLVTGKKYLCSAYCLTFDNPRFFYHTNATSGVNNAVYVDNSLRRFWFVVDGVNNIQWYIQGESGLNVSGTSYESNVFIGGFQVEEIPTDTKYGIAVIGDSTVAGGAGRWDLMNNTEWVKFTGSLLNAKFYNRGIGGNKTSDMIARWATDMSPLAVECKYAIIQGGINNLGNVGTTALTIQSDLQTMYDLAVADGFIPVMCTITPCNKTGTDEDIRNTVNAWIKATFTKVLDLADVVTDVRESNQIKRVTGWYGDGVHYAQKAKIAVADYVASRDFWEFRYPKAYQRVIDDNQFSKPMYTGSVFLDSAGAKRLEFLDFGTGSQIKLYEGANSANLHFYASQVKIDNPNGDIILNPKLGSAVQINQIGEFSTEMRVPLVAPSKIGNGQIWFDNTTKQLKFSADSITKTITFN